MFWVEGHDIHPSFFFFFPENPPQMSRNLPSVQSVNCFHLHITDLSDFPERVKSTKTWVWFYPARYSRVFKPERRLVCPLRITTRYQDFHLVGDFCSLEEVKMIWFPFSFLPFSILILPVCPPCLSRLHDTDTLEGSALIWHTHWHTESPRMVAAFRSSAQFEELCKHLTYT